MLAASQVGLRKDETRMQGDEVQWNFPVLEVASRGKVYYIAPAFMFTYALLCSLLTRYLSTQVVEKPAIKEYDQKIFTYFKNLCGLELT